MLQKKSSEFFCFSAKGRDTTMLCDRRNNESRTGVLAAKKFSIERLRPYFQYVLFYNHPVTMFRGRMLLILEEMKQKREKRRAIMAVFCSEKGRVLTAVLSGEIDHHAARSIMLELDREIESRFPNETVLDFRDVTFMDSSGIAIVLRTCKRMKESGGGLRAVNVPRQAGKVLKAAGIGRMVPVTYQEDDQGEEPTS